MGLSVIARRYSNALFNEAKCNNLLDKVHDELKEVVILYSFKNSVLFKLLNYPTFSFEERKTNLLKILNHYNISDLSIHFVILLIKRCRINVLLLIYSEYKKQLDNYRNVLRIKIIIAKTIKKEMLDALIYRLKLLFNKIIKYELLYDMSVLGGIKLELGFLIIDDTILNRLNKLSHSLIV